MLLVDGQLDIQVDRTAAQLTARGRELRFDCADLPSFLRSATAMDATRRDHGRVRGGRRQRTDRGSSLATVRLLATRLAALGLTLRVTSGGKVLLVLGRSARPGLAERLIRVPHLQLGSNREILRLLTR